MEPNEEFESVFKRLRALAASDPRQARQALGQLLGSSWPHLPLLLERAGLPGEGRLRQLIADSARARGVHERYAETLHAWREIEPDEFTRRALDAALQGNVRPIRDTVRRLSLVDRAHVEAYRYVSDRLRHRLRNTFMGPAGMLIRIRSQVENLRDEALRQTLTAELTALSDSLAVVGRVIEFDVGDGHFTVRRLSIADWLIAFNSEYGRRYRPVTLRLERPDQGGLIIGSDYLLGTVFWNLWINAQQAVPGSECVITVRFTVTADHVKLTVLDNGEGFPRGVSEAGFPDANPRPGHRGRGLLEVQEAIERLHGEAGLVRHDDGTYRIVLTFPRER